MLQPGQEVMVVAGIHSLHDHERLAMAVANAMRGMSTHDTREDGRFHAKTLTFLDGAVLREVCHISVFQYVACLLVLFNRMSQKTYSYLLVIKISMWVNSVLL